MNKHFCCKRTAHFIGILGLLPFMLLMLGAWLVPPDLLGEVINGQHAYGMVILSFVGAMHLGAALAATDLTAEQSKRAMLWSAMPAVFAWTSTMAGGFGFAVIMAGFLLAYQVDKRLYAWYPFPAWMIRLRLILTVAVIAMLMLTVIGGNLRG